MCFVLISTELVENKKSKWTLGLTAKQDYLSQLISTDSLRGRWDKKAIWGRTLLTSHASICYIMVSNTNENTGPNTNTNTDTNTDTFFTYYARFDIRLSYKNTNTGLKIQI